MIRESSSQGSEQEGAINPFKYARGYLDASGYYQFGVRYYDPSLGRWTQQDPMGGSLFDLNSGNRYTYVEGDPVNLVDPGGKSVCIPGSVAIALLIGAIGLVVTLFAIFAPPAITLVIAGFEISGTQLLSAVAAVHGFQAVVAGFTTSSAPVCIG